MMPRLTPMPFAGETRRRVPKVSKNQRVPLWTVEPDGQLFQDIVRVPLRLCNAEEHTNARHEFDNLLVANLARWTEWRRQRGWHLSEKPRVSGPFDPPEEDMVKQRQRFDRATKVIGRVGSAEEIHEFPDAGEFKWYVAEARFTREEPVYVRLSDMLELRHMALRYEVDPDRDPLPYNELPEGKDVIEVEGGLDPLVVAEERRQRLGLKRSDYLMGRLEDPL